MKVFKRRAKKDCCCGGSYSCEGMEKALEKKKQGSRIKILGAGCAKCISLENSVTEALQELHANETIEHVTDFTEIASYGVMSTPAFVIDGNVVSFGKVLNKEEALSLLEKAGWR